MNLGTIQTEFSQRAPDSPGTTTQQTIWANQGVKDIVRRTKCLSKSGTINLAASTANYDLLSSFSDYMAIDPDGGVHFYDGSDYRRVEPVSKDWLDRWVPNWRNDDKDDPKGYYIEGKYIYVYPTPSSAYTGGLKVYYYYFPTEMSASANDPFDSRTDLVFYHPLIIDFMLWRAKESLGEYLQAQIHKKDYLEGVQKMINELGEEPDMQEPFRPYRKAPVLKETDPALWGF